MWEPKQKYKAIVVIMDGVGDRPVPELNWKTPLQVANKPTLDKIADLGITGLMDPIEPGVRPGTDTGHLAIFGYDPYKYYPGRGPLEAAGVGVKLSPGDVAIRCNMATVEENNGQFIVVDRRAGRIKGKDVLELVKALNEHIKEVDGVKVEFYPATAHRVVLVLRGDHLSAAVSNSDPGTAEEGKPVQKVVPLENTPEAERTAKILNEVIARSYEVLRDHPVNLRRVKNGLLPANIIITRGAGMVPRDLKTFQEVFKVKGYVVAEEATIIGLARLLGMGAEIPEGSTAGLDTDVDAIARAALRAFENHDIVFVHVKGPDIAGHDANYKGKIQIIEKIDYMVSKILENIDQDKTIIALTADHTTPCVVRDHTGDPVPVAIMGPGVRRDDVNKYNELSCARGGLCRIRGVNLIRIILDLMNRPLKFGE